MLGCRVAARRRKRRLEYSRSSDLLAFRASASLTSFIFIALFAALFISPISLPVATRASADTSNLAVDALNQLPVKGRAPKTGYSREAFGQAWSDVNRNGCDTRNDILKRDLREVIFKPRTRDCVVLSGVLNDPYSGTLINFLRGETTSALIQIDHVVALSNAWQTGAFQLTLKERTEFANDPLNLLAVMGSLNSQKGDGDAATWLPPNKSFRCTYIARQIAVKKKYRLWVTAPERNEMVRILSKCPSQTLNVG